MTVRELFDAIGDINIGKVFINIVLVIIAVKVFKFLRYIGGFGNQ